MCCSIADRFIHPTLNCTILHLRESLAEKQPHCIRVLPLRPARGDSNCILRPYNGPQTLIMGIVNVTPDSFSDGGDVSSVADAVRSVARLSAAGAEIVDIGGVSTRPGASSVSDEEEARRVLPVLRGIRGSPDLAGVVLSIDTSSAHVAEQALAMGVQMINDTSAGRDPRMFSVAAKHHVPLCLMHMRGDPQSMMSLADYPANAAELIATIRAELTQRVRLALRAGVFRWNIVVDPGIGFAKSLKHNVAVLRELPRLTEAGSALASFPVLVGTSRKAFIGTILDRTDPRQRDWGTTAACVAAISGGALIVRLHNVEALRDAVRVADAIYR